MEAFEAVKTVLAVRQFQERPVPPETIQRIVEAGWLTGSSMNKQPWHFIVVEDREVLRQMGSLARSGAYIAQAAMAIAVVIERTQFAVSDGSRAIQSMILTAWSEGVGSNWVGFMGPVDIKPLLGVPEEMDILAVLPFGYPVKTLGRGKKKRKPLSEVTHRERFGQHFQ